MSIPLTTFFQSRVVITELLTQTVAFIKKVHSYETLKGHPEVVLMVCNFIEYHMDSNKYKIDKKELSIMVLDELFGLNMDEREQLRVQIEFLYSTNQIKGSIYQQIMGYFKALFKKKK